MTYKNLIYKLKSQDFSKVNLIFTVLTDDSGKTNLDSFIENNDIIDNLKFRKNDKDLFFQFYSFTQASEDQVSDFYTKISLLKTQNTTSITDIITNFESVFSKMKQTIQANINDEIPFVSLFYLHSMKEGFLSKNLSILLGKNII